MTTRDRGDRYGPMEWAQSVRILLKQDTVSGSGISWAICKSASRPRQITTPALPPPLSFYRRDAVPATEAKH